MEICLQIALPFAAFWFIFSSLLAPVTPNMENSQEGCAIRQRLTAERAELSSFSFDAFFLLSAMHLQVTNGNRRIQLYVTANNTAILTDDFKYEEKLLPRHISGWASFILSITDAVHLVTQDGVDITGLLEQGNLRIDPSQGFSAAISNVPLMSGCKEGGPTVSVNPAGEMNLLITLPIHKYNFTILGSQIYNLSMFINDHEITSLCGRGSADFTLEFHSLKKQGHRLIIPGTQPLSFQMTPKSSEGSEWITVSFHTTGKNLHVAYNLPWKERLTSVKKSGFVKLCSFDDQDEGDVTTTAKLPMTSSSPSQLSSKSIESSSSITDNDGGKFVTDSEMVPTAADELPFTPTLAQVSTISIDHEPSSTLEYFGSFELAVLVLILIILLIIVALVIALVFMKSRRKASVEKGVFPSQQSTIVSPNRQLSRNSDICMEWKGSHFHKDNPSPLKTPALFRKEPSNTAVSAKFAKSYRQDFGEQMQEENIYEEIITFGQIALTSSSASYSNHPVTFIIQEDRDGYVDMTQYERDRECVA